MITIDQLQVDYGKHRALDIDRPIRIRPGERVGIIGSNGAGKTTLLHALLGLIPSSGSFRLDTSPSEIAVHLQQNNYVSTMAGGVLVSYILAEGWIDASRESGDTVIEVEEPVDLGGEFDGRE